MTLPSSGPLSLSDIQGEFGGSNPIGMNEYYAGGGLVPSGTTGTYGAVPSSGALSIQNFYGTSNFVPIYIEDVFSTWIYAGDGSTQTITNGINVSGSGGLVWIKNRSDATPHALFDTNRGVLNQLSSNTTDTEINYSNSLTSFNSNGFTVGLRNAVNQSGSNMVSWTFRKQPKFFAQGTYTGTGSPRTVAHDLGSTPGCIIVKATNAGYSWAVYHRSTSATDRLLLNSTQASTTDSTFWNDTAPTSTQFTVGTSTATNDAGTTYVYYVFAHNAGGFGLTGTDNVISCGSFTTASGSPTATINLGYEPQWLLLKSTGSGNWFVIDSMRGWSNFSTTSSTSYALRPNSANAETDYGICNPTATGFELLSNSGQLNNETFIYVAIRRGPMKVPTVGTTVYTPAVTANDQTDTDMNFPVDVFWETNQAGSTYNTSTATRLSGNASMLRTSGSNNANGFFSSLFANSKQNYYRGSLYGGGTVVTQYGFRRAPSFMDIVCYTGTGVARTINHNLGTTPQWIIVKRRSGTEAIIGSGDWYVYSSALGNDYFVLLNGGDSASNSGVWNYTSPTSSVFSVGTFFTNYSGDNYVAYLFATCPGVSKVGNYTGNGALRTIDCGFTTGARFILIRQWGSGGGPWYLWDSARGISSGNDPFNYLGTTLADVTNTNYVATTSVGFQLTAAAFDTVNTSGAPYIFLAIA